MPTLDQYGEHQFVKLLYIGDSGTGKTGSLVSLVKRGFKLGIISFDNGLDPLWHQVRDQCPDKMANVSFIHAHDSFASGANVKGEAVKTFKLKVDASAYMEVVTALDTWEDGTHPKEWGKDRILVLDPITKLGELCYNYSEKINANLRDNRMHYHTAQNAIEYILSSITADSFKTNVVCISHVNWEDIKNSNGEVIATRGWPSTIGSKHSKTVAMNFNTLIQASTIGSGAGAQRRIVTVSPDEINLKFPNVQNQKREYPLNDGLARIFDDLLAISPEASASQTEASAS